MAFQISIGDVLMLSKIAWDISLAFSSGRKSAPAEFQEVQNQLQSLCYALDSVKSLSSEHPDDSTAGTIAPILHNCRSTLEHLEGLINKYMVIEEQRDGKDLKGKQWCHEIRKNWKKIRWTRQGGNLARLQQNLGVHVNSLNLTIAVMNSQMNQTTGQQVEEIREMLIDVYAWFCRNLKGRSMSLYDGSQEPQDAAPELVFSLHSENPETYDSVPLCDNAYFNSGWLENPDKPTLKCNCHLRRTAYGDIHDEELMQYFVSPMSLIVRLDGPSQSWKIWLSSGKTYRLTSLIIRNIAPPKLAMFENVISDLAVATAKPAVERGLGSLMILPSINPHTGYPVISILNLVCDTRYLYNKIGNIKLTANGHSFSTGAVEMAQLMHYRHLTAGGEWLFGETADIILNTCLDARETEMTEFTLTINSQTKISTGETGSNIRLFPCDCLSSSTAGQNVVKGVDVKIELTDEHAIYLLQKLRRLQDGLLLFRTQHARRNEKSLFELGLTQVMAYDYHVKDATVKLCKNLETRYYRLIVSNDSRSLCLSVDLSPGDLEHIVRSNASSLPVENCWVAETKPDYAHVYQEKSKSTLTCSDQHTQKLLMLMLQSVVRGENGVVDPVVEGTRYNELEG